MLAFEFIGLGRPVIDRTGLPGIYRIDMTSRGTPEGDGPDVRTALKDQLGLELVARKEPVKVLVIDRFERPDPN